MTIEVYKNRPIFYGCGDFLNDYQGITGFGDFRGDLSVMYFASISPATGECVAIDLVPLQIKRFRLARPSSCDVEWVRTILDRECRQFGAHVTVDDGKLVVSWPDDQ
jgi:poly-gamma-glutamate capsule biosynthesis protein CapA/YwtB (metallophosphatase superfamily)